MSVQDQELEQFSDKVLLKVETSDMTTIVVTSVTVAILVIFLLLGLCFRLGGHKLTWEKTHLQSPDLELERYQHLDHHDQADELFR